MKECSPSSIVCRRILAETSCDINGGAKIDHEAPRKRRFAAVQK
jgi:hypothetical protein